MLEIYLSTIFLWMVIIFCAIGAFYEPITKNGWNTDTRMPFEYSMYDVIKAFAVLILVSAIPIFRVLLVAMFYLMSKYTEKQLDEWVKRPTKKTGNCQEARHDE